MRELALLAAANDVVKVVSGGGGGCSGSLRQTTIYTAWKEDQSRD